jgi:hypothetical protein
MFDTEENNKQDNFVSELIQEHINKTKAEIELRRIIQRILFEISCQTFSAGLAKLLFTYAVDFNFTCGLCIVLASIPSLPNLSKLEFKKTEEGLTIYSMKKPIIILFSLGVRTLIVSSTLYTLSKDIAETSNNITYIYNQIKEYETPQVKDFLPPYTVQIVLLSALIVTIGMFLNTLRKRNPFE